MVGTPGGILGNELLTGAIDAPVGLLMLPAVEVVVAGGRDVDDAVTWLDKSTLNDETELLGSERPPLVAFSLLL